MSACRTTCKASIRWIAITRNSLAGWVLALGLGACNQEADPAVAGQSCTQMRAHFDAAFSKSVDAAVRKAPEEQRRHVSESQKTYLAMETKGCCAQEGVCPALNVN